MKFSINSKDFGSALATMSRVVASKNAMAILDCFRIGLSDNGICITAADADTVFASVFVPCETTPDGEAFCINAKRITDLIRKFKDGTVTVEVEGNTAHIKCGRAKYDIGVSPASEYPIRTIEPTAEISLSTNTLFAGLVTVKDMVSYETIRPMLTGVLVDSKPDHITFVGTDTHKLVAYRESANDAKEFKFILPSKTVGLILSLFAKIQEVTIRFSDLQAEIVADGIQLLSALVKGNYPDYNRVMGGEKPLSLKFDRASFVESLNRVSGFADTSSNMVVLEPDQMLGAVRLVADNPMYQNSGEEEIACEYNGQTMKIGLNASYLSSVLNIFRDKDITMHINTPSTPVVINEGNVTALLMPMQVIAE